MPILPKLGDRHAELATKFWSLVDVRASDECWPWKASTDGRGYGKFIIYRTHLIASRLAYALARAEPGKMLVLHRCDNPPCCNPAHLFLGTDADNVHDMLDKGRARPFGGKAGVGCGRGECHPSAKLTEEQARRAKFGTEPPRVLAREFGVGSTAITEIRSGRNWKWLQPLESAA